MIPVLFASALVFAALAWRFGDAFGFVISCLVLVSARFWAPGRLFAQIQFSCLIHVRPRSLGSVPDHHHRSRQIGQMAPEGTRLPHIVPDCPRSCQTVPDHPRSLQITSYRPRSSQTAPDRPRPPHGTCRVERFGFGCSGRMRVGLSVPHLSHFICTLTAAPC